MFKYIIKRIGLAIVTICSCDHYLFPDESGTGWSVLIRESSQS